MGSHTSYALYRTSCLRTSVKLNLLGVFTSNVTLIILVQGAHRILHVLQIHGYRMSLWAEHLGEVKPVFVDAGSLECVTEVNKLAQANWEQYIAEEVTDMRGHLMPYPIQVNADGTIAALEGHETFPDVGGNVLGTNQPKLPDSLTT